MDRVILSHFYYVLRLQDEFSFEFKFKATN